MALLQWGAWAPDTSDYEGQSFTFTLRSNTSDTALTVTLSGAGQAGVDSTHSVSVAAGDFISIKAVASGSASNSSNNFFSAMLIPS
jgi:hypothetical protein